MMLWSKIATTLLLLLVAVTSVGQESKVSIADHQALSAAYGKQAETILQSFVDGKYGPLRQRVSVSAIVEFDEARLQSDAQAFRTQQEEKRNEAFQRAQQQIYALKSGKTSDKSAAPKVTESKGPRFGKLNIDLDSAGFQELLSAPIQTGSEALSVSFTLPEFQKASFAFNAIDYVKNVSINILLPTEVSSDLDQQLKDLVIANLSMDKFGSPESIAESIKLSRFDPIPVKKASAGDWLNTLFDPSNSTIPIIVSVMILGVFILIATLLMAKVFGKVAVGISALAPEKESSDGDSGSDEVDSEPVASAPAVIAVSESKSKHDAAASMQALTSEMKTIRDQFTEIVDENASVVAELIRDLFYEKTGLEDLRDLLSFVGYKPLKPAMDLLPAVCVNELQAFIQDSRDDAVELLNGVEVVQRLYRDCVSKVTVSAETVLSDLREAIVASDDRILQDTVEQGSNEEIALVLKLLTVERGNKIVKFVPIEKLKDAVKLLDQPLNGLTDVIKGLTDKVSRPAEAGEQTSVAQSRFIIRMAKGATIDDEQSVLEMIGPDEWGLRKDVMLANYFYSDIKHLEDVTLKAVFDEFDARKRAEFLHICDQEIKTRILGQYKEGSKLKDMIQNELDLITNNKKRSDEVESSRLIHITDYMTKIRSLIKADNSVVEQALRSYAKQENLELPDFLAGSPQAESETAA